jgi:2'-5' RNA ligase
MFEQLLLLDLPPPPRSNENWFFAFRSQPAPAMSLRFDCIALDFCARCGLNGRPLGAELFHLSLQSLPEDTIFLPDFVARARRAAAAIIEPPFDLTFDRVSNFSGGRWGKRPLVVWGDNRANPVQRFRRKLGLALSDAGLGRFDLGLFNPHVTLLYDKRSVAEQKVEPFSWTVNEFFLVQSIVGESRHVVQGHWPLRA